MTTPAGRWTCECGALVPWGVGHGHAPALTVGTSFRPDTPAERALTPIASVLTVDRVARALRGMSTDPCDNWLGITDSPRAGEWETTEFAAALIAALTEDVP